MQRPDKCKRASEVEAVVHRVDPVNRELAVVVEGTLVNMYVPPDCKVVLRGERVKLRMVQPRDRMRVKYTGLNDFLIAREIEVQPGKSALSFSK
jgi:hypothetical protein